MGGGGRSIPLLQADGELLTRFSLAVTSLADDPMPGFFKGVTHNDWTSLEEWPPTSGAVTDLKD